MSEELNDVENSLMNQWQSDRGHSLSQPENVAWEESVESAGSIHKALSEPIHNMLQLAGVVADPADLVDALLYSLEGEYGEAALSMASVAPIVGNAIRSKKAITKLKKLGEKTVTVHRGYGMWHRGSMVRNGSFVSGGENSVRMGRDGLFTPLYTTESLSDAKIYAKQFNKKLISQGANPSSPKVLTFEVPESYLRQNTVFPGGESINYDILDAFGKPETLFPMHIFKDGLPREFLTKVVEL